MYKFTNVNIANHIVENNNTVSDKRRLEQIPLDRWEEILFDVDVSEDYFFGQNNQDLTTRQNAVPSEIASVLNYYFGVEALRNLDFSYKTLDALLKNKDSKHIAVLMAHGNSKEVLFKKNIWYAYETKLPKLKIQDWVDARSSSLSPKYGALIIMSCNPCNVKPKFMGVPIFYGEGKLGMFADELKLVER